MATGTGKVRARHSMLLRVPTQFRVPTHVPTKDDGLHQCVQSLRRLTPGRMFHQSGRGRVAFTSYPHSTQAKAQPPPQYGPIVRPSLQSRSSTCNPAVAPSRSAVGSSRYTSSPSGAAAHPAPPPGPRLHLSAARSEENVQNRSVR